MTSAFNSTLSWLDSNERERRAVLELVSALSEPGTLDELGIGSVRDTIADALFPGISTIQTRARYFLFIPWVLQMVEETAPARADARVRELQSRLREALRKTHGPGEGVIGLEAGDRLRRWPISIYWSGLGKWGIRRYPGSMRSYFALLGRPSASLASVRAKREAIDYGGDETTDGTNGNWAKVPKAPDAFLDTTSFALTAEEGHFLRDRIVLSHGQSYLAHILRAGGAGLCSSVAYPWEDLSAESAPDSARQWLHDARLLSLVHQGATLLYNLMLSEKLQNTDEVDKSSEERNLWSERMATAGVDLKQWDRNAMWARLRQTNPRVGVRTQDFCDSWYRLASSQIGAAPWNSDDARTLIRRRERDLKDKRARLTWPEARQGHSGLPSSERLRFRWPQVQRITDDILVSLG